MTTPKLYISYSWEPSAHKAWVQDLATRLTDDGVEVVLDVWHLKPGHSAYQFMQRMVNDNSIHKVVIVTNRIYQEKANNHTGGVGDEAAIISPEIYGKVLQTKFVAVVTERDHHNRPYLPTYCEGRLYIDFSDANHYEKSYEELLRWVYDKPLHAPPKLGKPPAFLNEEQVDVTTERTTITQEIVEPISLKPNSFMRIIRKLVPFGHNHVAPESSPSPDGATGSTPDEIAPKLIYNATYLPSLLEQSERLFSQFLAYILDCEGKPIDSTIILNAVNYAFNSRFVLYVSDSGPALSSRLYEDNTTAQMEEWFKTDLGNLLKFDKPVHFMSSPTTQRAKSRRPSLYVPLSADIGGEVRQHGLFIYGATPEKNEYADSIAVFLDALYQGTRGFTCFDNESDIKCAVFDAFKARYGYVSDSMYEERYGLFKDTLSRVDVAFEAIVMFDVFLEQVGVWGVEALARLPGQDRAPAELFRAAELWGVRFQTELDLVILERTLRNYRADLDTYTAVGSNGEIPVSINVYPNTILRDNYRNTLMEKLKAYNIKGSNIVIEISEKDLIQVGDSESGNLDAFRDAQNQLSDTCNITYAMDDYGSGHSSLSRALKLKPDYVKVDRDIILDHEPSLARQMIKQLVELKNNQRRGAFCIIVEGLDETTARNISLHELVNVLNVKYIQGHLFGKPSPTIIRQLPLEVVERIHRSLGWRKPKPVP